MTLLFILLFYDIMIQFGGNPLQRGKGYPQYIHQTSQNQRVKVEIWNGFVIHIVQVLHYITTFYGLFKLLVSYHVIYHIMDRIISYHT